MSFSDAGSPQYTFDPDSGTLTIERLPVKDAADYPWYSQKGLIRRVAVNADEITLGAHIFDGYENLEEVVLTGADVRLGDYCLAHCPKLKHLRFSSPVSQFGTGTVLGSDNISCVILTGQSEVEFKVYASLSPYNLEGNGGIFTGLDAAFYYTYPGDGFWSGISGLTAEGARIKEYDTDKNGQIDINDVAVLLNHLSLPDLNWANLHDLSRDASMDVGDISELLNSLSSQCAHTVSFAEAQSATCAQEGFSAHYRCEKCGCAVTGYDALPTLPHTVVTDEAVAPTCTETGLTAGSHCAVCGTVLTAQTTVPAAGHTVAVDPAVPATCMGTGLTEGSHCSVCHQVLVPQTVVPAAGHRIVTDEAVAPTCEQTGLTAGSHCSFCGMITVPQSVLPAAGHSVALDRALSPTCTETGLTAGSHCTVCGKILTAQEVLPASGHTVVTDEAVAPTCTDPGLTVGSHCSVCGAVLSAQTVVPASGHTVVSDPAIEPTCQKAGRTEGTHCSVCGIVLSGREYLPAVDHNYVSGVCTMCGKMPGPSEGLKYTLLPDGASYAVSGLGTCKDIVLIIPSEYNGLPVTKIAAHAFSICQDLTSVVIPEGIERIEIHAFSNCGCIKEITLPKTLTYIGEGAFSDCNGVDTVYFKGTLEDWLNIEFHDSPCSYYYGSSLYLNGELLTELTLPAGMTSVPERAFDCCTSLSTVAIPEGVTVIGTGAFYNCHCDDIYIPTSVTTIYEYALWRAADRIHYAGSEEEWNEIDVKVGVGTGFTNVLFNGE